MGLRLTLLGRSSLLLISEYGCRYRFHGLPDHLAFSRILVNGICWAVAAILFAPKADTRPILSLALLSWVSQIG